jgi:alkanesulfonate monooxygenase SsuD/methylene tetrahydromethanopterin reductase-like flavin-dependent oxidoreductase (luciferase family)
VSERSEVTPAAARRGVALTPMEVRRDVIVRAARLADDLGYEVFSVAEGWGLDATVVLAEIAARTTRITLVAGILSAWGRSPATIAMSAATLHDLSAGRFVLGLGASTRQLVEGWHDVEFAHPAERLRAVTTTVRALLAGERAPLRTVAGARPLRLGIPPADVPIWIAATGERTLPVAADLADGWYPLYLRRDRVRELVDEIGRRRAPAGNGRRPITVAVGPFTIVDRNLDAARAVAAACTAQYLARMGDLYPSLITAQGLGSEVAVVRDANPVHGRGAGVVPPAAQALLDEFTAYGDASRVREKLEGWAGAADITMVGLPPGVPWEQIEATLRAAAP